MTAVEWLVEQVFKTYNNTTEKKIDNKSIIEQAKEMEKQQQGYSEEDMNDYANYRLLFKKPIEPKEWFEQFKNK
jgi:uncharacterized protein (DUF2342 family)